jgi:hypothetical protein
LLFVEKASTPLAERISTVAPTIGCPEESTTLPPTFAARELMKIRSDRKNLFMNS